MKITLDFKTDDCVSINVQTRAKCGKILWMLKQGYTTVQFTTERCDNIRFMTKDGNLLVTPVSNNIVKFYDNGQKLLFNLIDGEEYAAIVPVIKGPGVLVLDKPLEVMTFALNTNFDVFNTEDIQSRLLIE